MKKGWGEIPSPISRGIPKGGERLAGMVLAHVHNKHLLKI
jgi:hypothetical protein